MASDWIKASLETSYKGLIYFVNPENLRITVFLSSADLNEKIAYF